MTKTIYTIADECGIISYTKEKRAIKEFQALLKRLHVIDPMIEELVNTYKQEHYVEYQIHTEYQGKISDSQVRFEKTILVH